MSTNFPIPLKEESGYYITEAGYIYRQIGKKEIRIKPVLNSKKQICVCVGGKNYMLVYLMIKYFIKEFSSNDRFTYRKNSNLEIPLKYIKIIKKKDAVNDEHLLKKWKCVEKSNSANNRCADLISHIEILRVLQMYNFRCVYCMGPLICEDWHLDHFNPISRGGRNVLENLVSSCSTCNLMKGPLEGHMFYKKCVSIKENYLWKNQISIN